MQIRRPRPRVVKKVRRHARPYESGAYCRRQITVSAEVVALTTGRSGRMVGVFCHQQVDHGLHPAALAAVPCESRRVKKLRRLESSLTISRALRPMARPFTASSRGRRWSQAECARAGAGRTWLLPEIGQSPGLADEINRLRWENLARRKSCEMRHFEFG